MKEGSERVFGPTAKQHRAASAVVCPTCNAEPGKACVQQRINPGVVRVRFHPSRFDAARARAERQQS